MLSPNSLKKVNNFLSFSPIHVGYNKSIDVLFNNFQSIELNFKKEDFHEIISNKIQEINEEMLARYFESQVFPQIAKNRNLQALSPIYKTSKDENFESYKENLISSIFGKDKVLSSMDKFRDKYGVKSDNENKFGI